MIGTLTPATESLLNGAAVPTPATNVDRTATVPDGLSSSGTGFLPGFTPEDTEFVVLSFEGPDPYCRAGGLGIRVTELTTALAGHGFDTHLYFIGAPDRVPYEQAPGLPLYLHRWGQWLSRHHPGGVYDGEKAKVEDFRTSIPRHVVQQRVQPAVEQGKRVVILSEEWHTAPAAIETSDALWRAGLRDRCIMVWNANNTLGFENVDFARLRFCQPISTVSRWMKHEMWNWGCNPIVVPNGIPARRLEPNSLADELAQMAQDRLQHRLTLGKVARFDPDKRWPMAIDAVAGLKRKGYPVLLIARGGLEAHGHEVIQRALGAGLRVRDVRTESQDPRTQMRVLLDAARDADVLNVRFFLPEAVSRALFRVADAMLQNSGREPFGLVGLEVMAAGGLAFTGATGEEYARPYENAIVLDTDDAHEIETTVIDLASRPLETARIRRAGIATAHEYTWDHALDILFRRLQFLAGVTAG